MKSERWVLQNRIEPEPFRRSRGKAPERVRCQHDEQHKGDRNRALHGQHIRPQRARQPAPKHGDSGPEQGERQHPKQHRAFMVAPNTRDPVEQRLGGMRIEIDVLDREVRYDVGMRQREKRARDEQELGHGCRRSDIHQPLVTLVGAPCRQHRLGERHRQGQQQCEMSDFDNQIFGPPFSSWPAAWP